jgi:hypothetical protein
MRLSVVCNLCVLALIALVQFTGCGKGGIATVPVSGKVLSNDQPLTTGTLTFKPEVPAAGQPDSVGSIKEDGSYTLSTGDKEGVPVGKYKVLVRSTVPSKAGDPYSLPKSVIAEKYGDANKSDLKVEVTASSSPGAYDLKLSK